MDVFEAVQNRHSVRSYLDTPIPEETAKKLRGAIEDVNRESGLHFALFTQELTGFAGKLKNVRNYIAFAGSGEKLEERIGYYGAKLMLEAQMLGLNSCWVAMSFNEADGASGGGKGGQRPGAGLRGDSGDTPPYQAHEKALPV